MSASAVGIEKPVVIDRKQNLQEHRLYWVGRRTQDVVLSALALVVLSPVMLATAIAIVVDDPSAGPIFSQERIGRDGKPFRFYKFRSMCPNAEAKLDDLLEQNEMNGPVFKIKDDPRITRVGKFIRKTSIDELPQLWNILKGDMSIVGPRPALPREVEQYGDYEKQRLYVTPGLTAIGRSRRTAMSCPSRSGWTWTLNMCRNAASGWIGKSFSRHSRCACWGMENKKTGLRMDCGCNLYTGLLSYGLL